MNLQLGNNVTYVPQNKLNFKSLHIKNNVYNKLTAAELIEFDKARPLMEEFAKNKDLTVKYKKDKLILEAKKKILSEYNHDRLKIPENMTLKNISLDTIKKALRRISLKLELNESIFQSNSFHKVIRLKQWEPKYDNVSIIK